MISGISSFARVRVEKRPPCWPFPTSLRENFYRVADPTRFPSDPSRSFLSVPVFFCPGYRSSLISTVPGCFPSPTNNILDVPSPQLRPSVCLQGRSSVTPPVSLAWSSATLLQPPGLSHSPRSFVDPHFTSLTVNVVCARVRSTPPLGLSHPVYCHFANTDRKSVV